ncbi:signal peptidase II [Lactococcus lactis]
MKKLLSLVIIVVGIVADQIFKNWIVANIQLGDTEKIWPNVLSLTYIKNDGAAWSSFSVVSTPNMTGILEFKET